MVAPPHRAAQRRLRSSPPALAIRAAGRAPRAVRRARLGSRRGRRGSRRAPRPRARAASPDVRRRRSRREPRAEPTFGSCRTKEAGSLTSPQRRRPPGPPIRRPHAGNFALPAEISFVIRLGAPLGRRSPPSSKTGAKCSPQPTRGPYLHRRGSAGNFRVARHDRRPGALALPLPCVQTKTGLSPETHGERISRRLQRAQPLEIAAPACLGVSFFSWVRIERLLPEPPSCPLGCHRPRVPIGTRWTRSCWCCGRVAVERANCDRDLLLLGGAPPFPGVVAAGVLHRRRALPKGEAGSLISIYRKTEGLNQDVGTTRRVA